MTRLARHIRAFRRDDRGIAAVEAALITSVFAIATMNAVEVGRYAYVRMEAEMATQAGAQAALVACDAEHVPATTACPGLNAAVATAIQGTSLGSAVTLNGAISEGYYCLNASGALVFASDLSSKPSNCSAVGNWAGRPALYLQVRTRYTYQPMFPGLTIVRTFPALIQKTSWMRML